MNVITNDDTKCAIVLEALKQVLDPEIGLNVADLGLIYQADFDEDEKKIFISMTLTTQFCPMGESIVDGVTRALQAAFPGDAVNVGLTFDPPWSHKEISEEGRKFLNK